MNTELLEINPKNIDLQLIKKAAKLLRENKLVAFPTETVYGLGANALHEKAVEKIFIAKGRPSDNPLIVHIADEKELPALVKEIPKLAKQLIKAFWPGPLTLIFEKSKLIPDIISANLNTVAIRIPSHPIALALIKEARVPIAAPSANTSTKPSPTKAEHVIEDLQGKIDCIIDGENCEVGIESTVLDCTTTPPTLLRAGGTSKEKIESVIGPIQTITKQNTIAKSPGMKYKHYAPHAKVILVEGEKNLQEIIIKYQNEGEKVGIITNNKHYEADKIFYFKNNEELAKNLFSYFRQFDKEKINIILVEEIDEKELGLGIMNRVRKAASEIIKIKNK